MIDIWHMLMIAGVVALFAFFSPKIIRQRKRIKENRKYLQKLLDNKCKGPHNWVWVYVGNKKENVCKKCRWVPSHENFIKKHVLDAELRAIDMENKLMEFREKRKKEIAEKYGLTMEKMSDLYDEVIEIKQKFIVEYIGKILEEDKESKNEERNVEKY